MQIRLGTGGSKVGKYEVATWDDKMVVLFYSIPLLNCSLFEVDRPDSVEEIGKF